MKLSLCILFSSVLAATAALSPGQTYESTGSDILPAVANGQMTTGAHDDNTGDDVPDVQVYCYSFQNNSDDPYFDQDPGINAPANSGLSPGSVVSFNVLSSLTYWNGTGPVTQTAPPANEQIQYNFAIYNVYVTGASASQAGFNIAAVASNQSFHRHLNAFLLASDGNADPSDGVVATPGIYMLTFQVVDQGVASSPPLYIVYDNGLDPSVLDQTRTYLRDAYAPLTYLVGLSDYPADQGNYPASWNIDAGGNWSSAVAWNLPVPSGAAASAMFGSAITAPRTITIDTPQTIGHLSFDNANAYTLVGAQLTLGDGSAPADVAVNAGSHVISAPLYLASPTTFAIESAGSTLTLTAPLTSATASALAKEGPGVLVTSRVNSAGIDVVQGTMRIAPGSGVSSVGALSVSPGATLDVGDNGIIVSYSGESPLASITVSLAAADDHGQWDQPGITSSLIASHPATAVGVVDNAMLHLTSFDGVPVGDSSVLLRLTYLGDANLDGVVDAKDITLLTAGELNKSSGWQNGDFNYDGKINSDDFSLLFLGAAEQSNPGDQLPEPVSATAVLFLMIQRRRRGMFPRRGH